MLESSGLVTLKKGSTGGAFLNDSNSAALAQGLLDGMGLRQYDAKELIDVRLILVNYVAEKACLHSTDAEIEELADVVSSSEEAEANNLDFEAPDSSCPTVAR